MREGDGFTSGVIGSNYELASMAVKNLHHGVRVLRAMIMHNADNTPPIEDIDSSDELLQVPTPYVTLYRPYMVDKIAPRHAREADPSFRGISDCHSTA